MRNSGPGSSTVFACGRYEGIDQRVAEDAARRMRVAEVSIGDYVLAGGEVATLVMIEAVMRLMPNVLGNPLSHQDDSHSTAGLLEGPSYTRPPVRRDLEVPPILLSGDHGKVAQGAMSRCAADPGTQTGSVGGQLDPAVREHRLERLRHRVSGGRVVDRLHRPDGDHVAAVTPTPVDRCSQLGPFQQHIQPCFTATGSLNRPSGMPNRCG